MALCQECRLAGRVWCPHNAAKEIWSRISKSLKQEMFGPTPPGFFVGHNFYPDVFWGPTLALENESFKDDPKELYGMPISKIIESRASLVVGKTKGSVQKVSNRLFLEAQLAAMSIKPIDAEARFSKAPSFSLDIDDTVQPLGASAPIEKFRLAQNPSIPKKVDSIFEEGLKAQDAIAELLSSGFDVYYLSRLLTAGVLGERQNRKIVPTKWAITATDDMAAKHFLEKVRIMKELEEFFVYSNTYLDNHFEILLLPGKWEYEQFEATVPAHKEKMPDGFAISEEYEPYFGRSVYAERQGGGYYAARLGVAEALCKMGRQAKAVVFREIGAEYTVSVGVWEVRENIRHAFLATPKKFQTLKEAMQELSQRLAIPLKEYSKRSRILFQKRLDENWD